MKRGFKARGDNEFFVGVYGYILYDNRYKIKVKGKDGLPEKKILKHRKVVERGLQSVLTTTIEGAYQDLREKFIKFIGQQYVIKWVVTEFWVAGRHNGYYGITKFIGDKE